MPPNGSGLTEAVNESWAFQREYEGFTYLPVWEAATGAEVKYPYSWVSIKDGAGWEGQPFYLLRFPLRRWSELPPSIQAAYREHVAFELEEHWKPVLDKCAREVAWNAYALQWKANRDERMEAECVAAFNEMVEACEAGVPLSQDARACLYDWKASELSAWNRVGKAVDMRLNAWDVEKEGKKVERRSTVGVFACVFSPADNHWDKSGTAFVVRRVLQQRWQGSRFGPVEVFPEGPSRTWDRRSRLYREESNAPRLTMQSLPVALFDPTAYDAFVSHKQSDCADFAKLVKEKLTERGYRVFLDADNENDIDGLMGVVKKSKVTTERQSRERDEADRGRAVHSTQLLSSLASLSLLTSLPLSLPTAHSLRSVEQHFRIRLVQEGAAGRTRVGCGGDSHRVCRRHVGGTLIPAGLNHPA